MPGVVFRVSMTLFDVNGGLGSDTAHALHDVEQDPFGLQQRNEASLDVKGDVARADMRTVLDPFV